MVISFNHYIHGYYGEICNDQMSNIDMLTRTNMLRIQADLTTSQIRYTDHVSSARFTKGAFYRELFNGVKRVSIIINTWESKAHHLQQWVHERKVYIEERLTNIQLVAPTG